MRLEVFCCGIFCAAMAMASAALAQSVVLPDATVAQNVADDPGELVTLYGARRFDGYYEPSRRPPATDPITGWPLDGFAAPFLPVGGYAYARGYGYSPYGYGYYRSYYRPGYVPYGYGYGWGYRYPFGYYPWNAFRYDYLRPWYGLYRPWYGYGPAIDQAPYVDHGPTLLDVGVATSPQSQYGGCFYW